MVVTRLSEDLRASLRLFAFYLANGTVDTKILDGIDYRPSLMDFGSNLEMVFTIFTNLLELDEAGNVTNDGVATQRAAEWIRHYCDPGYSVDPPFEPWETELAGP
jgi:hypothetical protein